MRAYRTERRPYAGNDPQLMEPEIEPTAGEWEQARQELGIWASNAQLERRALQLAGEAIEDNDTMAEEAEAESRLDDIGDHYGY